MATQEDKKDYDYYYRWTYLIPVSLLVSIVAFGLITPFVIWLSTKCARRCCQHRKKDYIIVYYLRNAMRDVVIRANKYFLLEFDYSTDLIKENEPHKISYSYTMFGATVKFYVLQYFFIIFLSLVLVSFILFWNTFTSNVFFGCDPHFDCFPLHTSNETPIHTISLKNCSEFAENENVTILCFQLVYRYSEGIGEAGGFLFIMQVIVNLLIFITVRIRTTFSEMYLQTRKMNPKKTPVCSAKFIRICTLVITVIVIPTSYALITVGVPLGFYQIRPEFYASLQTPQRFLQFLIYLFINFVLLLIPIFVALGTEDNLPEDNQVLNDTENE